MRWSRNYFKSHAPKSTESVRAQPVRLDDLLAGIVSDCSIEASARGCSLVFNAPGPVTISGDQNCCAAPRRT